MMLTLFLLFVYVTFTVKENRYVTDPNQAIYINYNSITSPSGIFDNLHVKLTSFDYQNPFKMVTTSSS